MDGAMDPDPPARMTMQEYREHYRKQHDEFLRKVTKADFQGIIDVVTVPRSVDMTDLRGTNQEVAADIDQLYANDGR
jgi:hypothetical protein